MSGRLAVPALLALSCIFAWAQSGTGTIQGTVQDPGGAVVPGATVRLVHLPTSGGRETVTNTAGLFSFPALPIGPYKVTVQAAGMQAWEGELVLQVGQVASINSKLNLGSTATEVTVVGDVTPLVVESSPTLGAVVERERIEQLPLNGRFLESLIRGTVPGLESGRTFGLRDAALEYVQDGAALINRDTGGAQARPPGLDTIQEFKVETNNSSAKVNRPATVVVSTKAGSNQLHGSVFETMRNNSFGVARRRQDFYDKPPKLVRNEFGGSLGGPIVLPKLYDGRNRSFFFGAWEGYRNRASNTTSLTMPTMAMRKGDFSALVDSAGRKITLYDPWTTDSKWGRQPFPNNQIPLGRMSPLAKYLYSVTPAPTNDRNPLVSANFFGPGPDNREDNTLTLRLDHRVSDADQVFVRVSHGDTRREYLGNEPSIPTLDNSTNVTYRTARNMSSVGSWTHSYSPTLFGETLLNWSYENLDFYAGDYFRNWAKELGLPNPFNEEGFPYIYDTGFDMFYVQPDNRRNNRTWVFGVDQNFTKMAGRHELQFGGRFRNERMFVLPDQGGVHGRMYFNSQATALYDPSTGTNSNGALPRTGHNAANLFLGVAREYQAVWAQKMYRFRDREYSMYLQDNWKVGSRLTLNLGLRYEYHPALHEQNGLFTGFDPERRAIVNGLPIEDLIQRNRTTQQIVDTFTRIGVKFLSADDVGLPRNLTYNDALGFGPRVGFAYKAPAGAKPLVVRGGFSLFVYPPPLRNFNSPIRSNPPFQTTFTRSFSAAQQSPDGLQNWALRSVPQIVAGVNSADAIDPNKPGGVNRGGFTVNYFDPEQPLTRVSEWNFTLEREVRANIVARIAYVGNHGFNLEQFRHFNQAPNSYIWFLTTGEPLPTGEYSGVARRSYDKTAYGDIRRYQKTGYSNYNGITFEMQRKFAGGYGFQFFYVLSNAFRVAGDGWRDDLIPDPAQYLPGSVPADIEALNRFMNYRRDDGMPKHRFRWNWLADLPFGKGKPMFSGAPGWVDRMIGGWQIAGFGSYRSRYWTLPTSNWGALGDIEIYGTKYPVEDCRSGACIPGYLYWNGYIPANRINSYDANGKPNGVMSVPDSYRPAHMPIIPQPKDPQPGDPMAAYYDSNNVWLTLKNGSVQRVGMDTGLHPWRNQFVPGPWQFGLDASLFKTIKVGESVAVRLNADFFNVLNNPGLNMPSNSSGILSRQSSSNGPRQLQLTLRVSW